jgi:hypothetical protein
MKAKGNQVQNSSLNSLSIELVILNQNRMGIAFRIFLSIVLFGSFGSRGAREYSSPALSTSSTFYSELFDSEEILQLVLSGDMRRPLNDKSQNPKFYPLTLSYLANGDSEKSLSIEVKARGNFRRLLGNCTYAPLMLRFENNEVTQSSIFSGQKELKLVMPCQGDEYVIREWLVYKLYNLLTPLSFKVRLVNIKLEQEGKTRNPESFYGFLLEDEKQLATRNGLFPLKRKLNPRQTQTEEFQTLAVFEYLIGNTDWSVQYLQNIKLLNEGGAQLPFAVPYDFDHAGIVNAPYALPAEGLKMSSVRERRYRGYCVEDLDDFIPTINHFKALKQEIYRLYNDMPLVEGKYLEQTRLYLDDFYAILNDEPTWRKDFGYPCDPKGTGNVVIKGLKGN